MYFFLHLLLSEGCMTLDCLVCPLTGEPKSHQAPSEVFFPSQRKGSEVRKASSQPTLSRQRQENLNLEATGVSVTGNVLHKGSPGAERGRPSSPNPNSAAWARGAAAGPVGGEHPASRERRRFRGSSPPVLRLLPPESAGKGVSGASVPLGINGFSRVSA